MMRSGESSRTEAPRPVLHYRARCWQLSRGYWRCGAKARTSSLTQPCSNGRHCIRKFIGWSGISPLSCCWRSTMAVRPPRCPRRGSSSISQRPRHRDYGGLQLMHELAKQGDPDGLPSMPVVFTSALAQSMPGWRSVDQLARSLMASRRRRKSISTIKSISAAAIHLTWDAVEEFSRPDCWTTCSAPIRLSAPAGAGRLNVDAPAESSVFPAQLAKRTVVNETSGSLPQRTAA